MLERAQEECRQAIRAACEEVRCEGCSLPVALLLPPLTHPHTNTHTHSPKLRRAVDAREAELLGEVGQAHKAAFFELEAQLGQLQAATQGLEQAAGRLERAAVSASDVEVVLESSEAAGACSERLPLQPVASGALQVKVEHGPLVQQLRALGSVRKVSV